MNGGHLNTGDTFTTSGVLRHIFLESLASSPSTVSSSSPTLLSPSDSCNISIETCIKYLRSRFSQTLPNDVLDKFRNLLSEAVPSGRINWKTYKSVAQHWIASIDSQIQYGNNNLNESNRNDSTNNADDGLTLDVTRNILVEGSKSTELVEWPIMSFNHTDRDTSIEYGSTNVSNSSHEGTDNTTELELRLRMRRLDEDNAWLRDELERTEELSANYQRQLHTIRQRLHQISEKCNKLERENEEQKAMILILEQEEKRYLKTLERAEKERKIYMTNLDQTKELIPNLNEKIERLKNEKKNYLEQLTIYRSKLEKKEVMCEILQEKNDELTEHNTSLENYYEKMVRHLQERSDDLKNENFELYSRMSSGHPSIEVNLTTPSFNLNSSSESLPNDPFKIPPQNSLYEELKASGFPLGNEQGGSKIRELEEELNWCNEEIHNATKQLDDMIHQLGRKPKSHDKISIGASEYQEPYIPILLDRITLLSDAVTETLQKPPTSDSCVQVSAEPLEDWTLKDFNILTFAVCLEKSIAKKKPASGDFFDTYFTIGPTLTEKSRDVEVLPKSIYTCTERSNRRRWGRNFNRIAVGTPSRDAPINGNSSPSPHSSTEVESKIILRSAMNVDDNISRVNDGISPNTHKEANINENPYCELFSERLSLSPICGTPNMTDKNVPRRKQSVFSRTYNIEEVFDSPHVSTERITSSTPAPEDNLVTNLLPIFASTAYRTEMDCSDSSDSFQISKLHSSIEEDTSSRLSASREHSILIAPPRLNLDIENGMKKLAVTFPIQQDTISPGIVNGSAQVVAMAPSDMEVHTNSHDKTCSTREISTLSCIDNINNNFNEDSRTKKSSESIDITQASSSDVDSTSQPVSNVCGVRAVSEKRVAELTSVIHAMSSGEDSSDSSDCDPAVNRSITNGNTPNDDRSSVQDESSIYGAIQSNADDSAQPFSVSQENNMPSSTTDTNKEEIFANKTLNKREIVSAMKRSRSESESLNGYGRKGYRCTCSTKESETNGNNGESHLMVFPSLPDIRLKKSGIANLPDNDDNEANYLGEDELARKFTAFSLGLCTDRLTLSRRRALSIRQRDQAERNLVNEVMKMQQNIQELAPLCFDSESIARIEHTRDQVDIISRCAHKISCTAETLGAVQQEYRISRAINLADRYLRILRNRCEKLVIDLSETKRILMENNIIIDEHTSESTEELTTLRYRGLPTNNRTMTAKRRASIATIVRPIISGPDATKDGIRQRNSVSGRVTHRRPSFSTDSQRWETEKLKRTESSNSVIELHEIFEQAESRRVSREENNNIMRFPANICESDETDSTALAMRLQNGEESLVESAPDQELLPTSGYLNTIGQMFRLIFASGNQAISWRLMLWCIIVSFFIGFYVKDAVSSGPCGGTPFKWWSIEEYLERHVEIRNSAHRPI